MADTRHRLRRTALELTAALALLVAAALLPPWFVPAEAPPLDPGWIAVDEAVNGWPLLEAAEKRIPLVRRTNPGPRVQPALDLWLAEAAGMFELVDQALARPCTVLPRELSWEDQSVEELRYACLRLHWVMHHRAELRFATGQAAAACDDLRRCIVLGRRLADSGGPMAAYRRGFDFERLAVEQLGQWLWRLPAEVAADPAFDMLAELFDDRFDDIGPLRRAMAEECRLLEAALDRPEVLRLQDVSALGPATRLRNVFYDPRRAGVQLRRCVADVRRSLALPARQRRGLELEAHRLARGRIGLYNRGGTILALHLASRFEDDAALLDEWRAHRAAGTALIALRRYEQRTGRLPDDWAQVVAAGLLGAPPIDPLDGLALRLDAAKRRLWSVGRNGIDDGGSSLQWGRRGRVEADLVWPLRDVHQPAR